MQVTDSNSNSVHAVHKLYCHSNKTQYNRDISTHNLRSTNNTQWWSVRSLARVHGVIQFAWPANCHTIWFSVLCLWLLPSPTLLPLLGDRDRGGGGYAIRQSERLNWHGRTTQKTASSAVHQQQGVAGQPNEAATAVLNMMMMCWHGVMVPRDR